MTDEDSFVQMSVAAVRSGLSDSGFRLLAEIGTYAWESRGSACTASQRRLAEDLGWSIDKVRRAAKELETAGYLTNLPEAGKPNTYQLTPSRTAGGTPSKTARGGTANSPGVPLANLRDKAEEGETDERSRRSDASPSKARKATTRQLELIAKLSQERGVEARAVTSAKSASAEIDRLVALPKSNGWEPATEPDPYSFGSDYSHGITSLAQLERTLGLTPGSWRSYSEAQKQELADRFHSQRGQSAVAA